MSPKGSKEKECRFEYQKVGWLLVTGYWPSPTCPLNSSKRWGQVTGIQTVFQWLPVGEARDSESSLEQFDRYWLSPKHLMTPTHLLCWVIRLRKKKSNMLKIVSVRSMSAYIQRIMNKIWKHNKENKFSTKKWLNRWLPCFGALFLQLSCKESKLQ